MHTLKIGKKNYKLEYGFEAAYNEACVEKTLDLIDLTSLAGNLDAGVVKQKMCEMPKLVTELFAIGLLENHAESVENAKELLKQYLKENKGESFISLSGIIAECMSDDGFLQLLGLVEGTNQDQTEENVIPMNPEAKE